MNSFPGNDEISPNPQTDVGHQVAISGTVKLWWAYTQH